jgi:hypothetical protein
MSQEPMNEQEIDAALDELLAEVSSEDSSSSPGDFFEGPGSSEGWARLLAKVQGKPTKRTKRK